MQADIMTSLPVEEHPIEARESSARTPEGEARKSSPNKSRLIQLDVLRGIAILLVLGNHAPIKSYDAGAFHTPALLWERFGWTGVDLFFVLSGFLIGGLLFHELRSRRGFDAKRFIIRRGFKIWPGYYLCVLFGLALTLARTHGNLLSALSIMAPNFLHIQNYVANPNRPIEQTWSLAVEEHFYLALPLFLWLVTRRRKDCGKAIPAVPVGALLTVAFCLLYRLFVNRHLPFAATSHAFETHIRIDSLFVGVLLAYLHHYFPERLRIFERRSLAPAALGLGLIAPMLFLSRESSPFVWTIGYTMLAWGYGLLLLTIVRIPVGEGWAGRLLAGRGARLVAWTGFHSYPIYLWHGIFAARVIEYLHLRLRPAPGMESLSWLLGTGAYVAMAALSGALMGSLTDRRALAIRDRMFPARADAGLSPSQPTAGGPDAREARETVETGRPDLHHDAARSLRQTSSPSGAARGASDSAYGGDEGGRLGRSDEL